MKQYLKQVLLSVLGQLEGVPAGFEPALEKPREAQHGDLSTNCALQLARHLRRSPMSIASDIEQTITLDAQRVAACEVVPPGFINFRFARSYRYQELAALLAAGPSFGRSDTGRGQRALVEFVSANPTGPLTVGHGRNAVLGDTIANLLEWSGYQVEREYYFNDAGRQMRILGQSVRARYEQELDERAGLALPMHRLKSGALVPATFPRDGYLGTYIMDIARSLADMHGEALRRSPDLAPFTGAAKQAVFRDIANTLTRLGIRMDTYFNEHSLYEQGVLEEVLSGLRASGHLYEKDGATWLKTSVLGKDQDTVLVKQSGEPTYRLPDIAYHRDKLKRGYDLCINIFGADHIATYPDILQALRLLGLEADRIEVIIYQFVTLMRAGEEVKMSTRRANFVTLDELIDEVGADVTRFFFLMRSAGRHLEFDLDLAKEASDTNPVYYLQYAHARICSIVNKARSVGFDAYDAADLTLLTHDAEVALMREVVRLPEAMRVAALAREPHRLAGYLRTVAEAFSRFYHYCRIVGEAPAVASARMALALGTRQVLCNGLTALGISAPVHMDRR